MLSIKEDGVRRSLPRNYASPPHPPTRAIRRRSTNLHSGAPTNSPFLPAVSSLGGFRTPAPHPARPSCKGPASETLHLSGLSPFASPRPSNGEKFTNASERGPQFELPAQVQLHAYVGPKGYLNVKALTSRIPSFGRGRR